MSVIETVSSLSARAGVATRRAAFLAPLLARLTVGAAFAESGWGKVHNLEKVAEYFAELGIPAPAFQATFVSFVELICGSLLVSYTRARAEALGLKGDVGIGSRAERVVVIVSGLVLAPWGVLPWAIYVLAITAWITVIQRVLSVRAQLRAR